MTRTRRRLAVLAALLAGAALAACGKHLDEDAPVIRLKHEGFYLPLGELKYQVQGTRQLNPDDAQDRYLIRGVPRDESDLGAEEVWFAVFLQVENEAAEPQRPSGEIKIHDTQDTVYEPVPLDESNVFAYRSTEPIPPGEIMPVRDTPAFDTPTQGALLLFKVTLQALDNRPLELEIEGAGQTGIIELDV